MAYTKSLVNLATKSGLKLLELNRLLFEIITFFGLCLLKVPVFIRRHSQDSLNLLFNDLYLLGPRLLPIILYISITISILLSIMISFELRQYGLYLLARSIVMTLLIRQVCLFIVVIILMFSAGIAHIANLSNLSNISDDEAIINIIIPKILVFIIVTICLFLYSSTITIYFGYLIASYISPDTAASYLQTIFDKVSFLNITITLIKSISYAALIGVVFSYYGLKCYNNSYDIKHAIKHSFTITTILIILTDICIEYLLTGLLS